MDAAIPVQAQAQGYYEPSLTVTFLPRCPNPLCPDPIHPLARKPSLFMRLFGRKADPKVCPGCGGPAAEPVAQEVEAVEFTGARS